MVHMRGALLLLSTLAARFPPAGAMATTAPRAIRSLADLGAAPNLVLFLGNGPRRQYASLPAALRELWPRLAALSGELSSATRCGSGDGDDDGGGPTDGKAPGGDNGRPTGGAAAPDGGDGVGPTGCAAPGWIAVFGGDSFADGIDDLGAVMHAVQAELGVRLLAVAGWDDVDAHVDLVYRYEIARDGAGCELYGGFDRASGAPVGGSAVYLAPEWLAATRAVVAIGPPCGRVGAAELEYVEALRRRHERREARGDEGGLGDGGGEAWSDGQQLPPPPSLIVVPAEPRY